MNKNSTKKKTTYDYNEKLVEALAIKYDFTPRYIRQILSDERKPTFADAIKKEYKDSDTEINKIIKKVKS